MLGMPMSIIKRLHIQDPCSTVNQIVRMPQIRRMRQACSPQVLLPFSDTYQARNPRDMVYGFQAIIDLKVAVDYKKSIKDVYIDRFKSAMTSSITPFRRNMMVYAGLGVRRSNKFGLPS